MFALAFGGNEMPGYHTGPACHLTCLTGARHRHLDSAGYSLDQKAGARGGDPHSGGCGGGAAGGGALAAAGFERSADDLAYAPAVNKYFPGKKRRA